MAERREHLRQKARGISQEPGVYFMRDRLGALIYVGKAKNLRRRVSSYFLPSRMARADVKTRALMKTIWDFEIQEVRNEDESLILESKLIKEYRPRFNIAMRDDKRFYLVKVDTKLRFPRFVLTRLRREDGAKYFGPFVHSVALRGTLEWLNREFGLRTCRQREPDEVTYKHCHADVIRNCSAPCVGKVSEEEYRARVEEAMEFLSGKGKRARLKGIKEEMQEAAAEMDFERAASLRDVVENLEKTLSPTRQFRRGRGVSSIAKQVRPKEDMEELGQLLELPRPPRVMECFDISNVSSTHIVASMVRFTDGAADNGNYRRYRVKSVEGQDDFASMAEVVWRRYRRIVEEARKELGEKLEESQESLVERLWRWGDEGKCSLVLPDLVIVDGGKGQLSAAFKQLHELGLGDLPVVGLAKQREEIFFPDRGEPVLLDHATGALKLMQRIRDEAHRFANLYNELLLRKRMKESLLDDVPGMSAARKGALLRHFGSVAKVKKASVKELQAVDGVGPKTAQGIVEYFAR